MGEKFALIVGNSEYQDAQLARLVAPEADVEQLAAVLRDREIGAFDEVKTVLNELSYTILPEIARFFKDKKPDDLLLLYFSGHGVRDDQGSLYLAVKNTLHDLLTATAIPAGFITGEMDRSRSRRQVLILDCCHSGAFAQGAKGVLGESVGTAAAFQGIGAGRVVLTATDATQYAWEGDRVVGEAQSSVFTKYLINGLKTGEADTAGDGWITVDELYDYVYQQVVSATPKQIPGKWSYKQQGEIVLAKNSHPVVKPAELPLELQQSIGSPLAWVREGAVNELSRLLQSGNPALSLAAYQALKPLTDDDSRRVANSAAQVVTAYEAQLKASAEEEENKRREREEVAARVETERLEAERLAQEKAEQERLAREHAEAERVKHEQEEKARKRKDYLDDLMNRGRAALSTRQWPAAIELFERVAKEEPNLQSQVAPLINQAQREIKKAEAAKYVGPIIRAAVPARTIWVSVLMTSIVWGIVYALGWTTAYAISSVAYNLHNDLLYAIGAGFIRSPAVMILAYAVSWGASGAIGGLGTGLALRRVNPSVDRKELLQSVLGWAIAYAIGFDIVIALFTFIFRRPLTSLDGAIVNATSGALGGLICGLVLRHTSSLVEKKRVSLITAAWAIAYVIGWWIAYTIRLGNYRGPPDLGVTASLLIAGLTAGAIGGSVTFWQFSRAEQKIMKAESPERGGLIARPALPTNTVWLPVLMTAIAWGIALFISELISLVLRGVFFFFDIPGAIIGGFMTGLVLRRTKSSIQWKQILLITLGWLGAFVLTDQVYFRPGLLGNIGFVLGWCIIGALGGLTTGLILWRMGTSLQWKQLFIVSIGWALGFSTMGIAITSNQLRGMSLGIPGAIAGLIGAAIMFWQLRQAPPQT